VSEQDMGWDGQQYCGFVKINVERTASKRRAVAFSPCTGGTTVAIWLNSPSKAK